MEDRTIQTHREHRRHVAWILVKDNDSIVSTGTFFLVTESLGLTCYQVVKDVLKFPDYSIEIYVSNTEMGAEEWYSPAEMETYSEKLNYAFLRIPSPFPGHPGGLLQHLAPLPQDEAVAIIGHPQGQNKQIDVRSVFSFYNHEDSALDRAHIHPSFLHILTKYHYLELLDPELITYKTNFYERGSGAPIFSECGELVAMHSGGYTADTSPKSRTVIEYGRSMVEIIIRGAEKIKDLRHKFLELVLTNESLQNYISPGSHATDMKTIIKCLKELWKTERNQEIRKPEGSRERDTEMEAPKITQRMIVRGYAERYKNNVKNENVPLTFQISLSLQFTLYDEDDLRNALMRCSHYISQRPSVLGSLLSPSLYCKKNQKPSSKETPGCYRCKLDCTVCPYIREEETFSSYRTGNTYPVSQRIDCNSSYVAYLISCTECRLQYVGCTKLRLKTRIQRHVSDVSHPNPKNPSMVSKHFRTVHDQSLQFLQLQGIKMVKKPFRQETRENLLKNEETYWIWKLKTLYPNGLNLRTDFVYGY